MSAVRLIELLAQKKTLALATANMDGLPTSSYCPYLRLGNDFFVFVSTLARHTTDLAERTTASIMFIEDESQADDILAMRRLILDCNARLVDRGDATREPILDLFGQHLSLLDKGLEKKFKLLRSFPDFQLYAFTPSGGRFVCGFGRAYRVNEKLEIVEHLNADQHATPPPAVTPQTPS